MKKVLIVFLAFNVLACAKISVETKKPIKVDINMRVDIYQHVVKDADSINDQIYGDRDKDFNAIFRFNEVYAADSSSEAIARRKARLSKVEGYFSRGYVGENRDAFLAIRSGVPSNINADVESLISAENKDREILYQATAKKNNTDVSSVRKIFFENDYNRSPAGYWFEVNRNGQYKWERK